MIVYKTVRPMLSDRGLSLSVCLPVTLVYCGQTVGGIKMPLGTDVGLSPDNTVLDGIHLLPRAQPPIFGSCLLWPNCWMDQDSTYH